MVKVVYGQGGAPAVDCFRILGGDGRWLRCFFGGDPDWTHSAAMAQRYDAETAAQRLQALHARGIQAGAVSC